MITPIARKNTRRQSSRQLAFKVWPKICSPYEWRDNLRILMTRINRTTRNITIDLTRSGSPTAMKNGRIAKRSIQLRTSFMNFVLLGHVIRRSKYSIVNHVAQTASMILMVLYSVESLTLNLGNVSIQKVVTDMMMKVRDRNAMPWKCCWKWNCYWLMMTSKSKIDLKIKIKHFTYTVFNIFPMLYVNMIIN